MKVLIIGANGQVGSELILLGKQQGIYIIAADSTELDITKIGVVKHFIYSKQPDIVINAAAYTAVDKAEEKVELAFAVNSKGPANLAEACCEADIPLLHISTDYVFDGKKAGAYYEDDAPNPKGVYGESKLEGEHAVATRLDKYIILRVAWVFAASGNNFVRTMLHLAAERDQLSVTADQQGAPTWAGDIANALLTITKRYCGIYHYTGSPATIWHGFAQTIFKEAKALELLDNIRQCMKLTRCNTQLLQNDQKIQC